MEKEKSDKKRSIKLKAGKPKLDKERLKRTKSDKSKSDKPNPEKSRKQNSSKGQAGNIADIPKEKKSVYYLSDFNNILSLRLLRGSRVQVFLGSGEHQLDSV